MRRDLDLDASPTLGAPLRFLLNAPVFAVLASALLFYAGPSAFATRWSAFTLAATHLMTLGVFASAMMGALLQILPVVAGVHVAAGRTGASGIHALLTFGTIALAGGFVSSVAALFPIAALACGAAVLWFVGACAIGLARGSGARAQGLEDILRAIRLALAALTFAVALGACLAVSLAHPVTLAVVALTDMHLLWGLGGWVGLLTAGVAYQVIPMFQVTEPYPRWLTRWFAPASLFSLVLASLSASFAHRLDPHLAAALVLLPLCGFGVFAFVTLALLRRRKRAEPDATTLYWRTSMASLVGSALVATIAAAMRAPSLEFAAGVLLLVGAILSAINGMLYKIVPFLLWYHLQAALDMRSPAVPKVKAVLPDSHARAQFWVHLGALVSMLAACVWPGALARPAAFALAVSSAWFGVNVARALRVYRRAAREIESVRARRA